MTRPARWLSTLRSRGRPGATQDSLPAAGQALPGGVGYPQGPIERFPLSLPPFPSFPGALKPDAYGGDVLAVAGDITDPAVADRVVGDAVARYGRVDTLVNN